MHVETMTTLAKINIECCVVVLLHWRCLHVGYNPLVLDYSIANICMMPRHALVPLIKRAVQGYAELEILVDEIHDDVSTAGGVFCSALDHDRAAHKLLAAYERWVATACALFPCHKLARHSQRRCHLACCCAVPVLHAQSMVSRYEECPNADA